MVAKRTTGEQVERMVAAAVARVQELAVDGVAPSAKRYLTRRGTAPTAQALLRHGVTWLDVVERAGLRSALLGSKKGQQPPAASVPAEVEAEIKAAFAAAAAAWRRERPMAAIPTRLEVREWPLADGSGVVRVVRAYASLR